MNLTGVSLMPSGEPGSYTGTGYLQLPFQNKRVKVSIKAFSITTGRVICNGTVTGVSDQAVYWPNFNPPASQHSEICLPVSTDVGFNENGYWMPDSTLWNPQGFDENGNYIIQPPYEGYVPGGPIDSTNTYDPNGFDSDCINVVTQTEYDPNGCSCTGIDTIGAPCEHTLAPYFWLNNNPALDPHSVAGLNFVQNNGILIQTITQQYINALHLEITIKVDSIRSDCDSIRNIMNGLVTVLQYSPTFIFGPQLEYLNEGLSANFASPPEVMTNNIAERDPNTKKLEQEHVYLYGCDQGLGEHKQRKQVIDYFKTQAGFDSLLAVITDLIKRLPDSEIKKFNTNPIALTNWIKEHVNTIVEAKYQALLGGSTSYLDTDTPHKIYPQLDKSQRVVRPSWGQKSPSKSTSPWTQGAMLASADSGFEEMLHHQSWNPSPEDIAFQFNQGFDKIYGVDRGFFLEHIVNERKKTELFPDQFFTANDSLLQPIELKTWSGGRYYKAYLDSIKVEIKPSGGTYTGFARTNVHLILEVPGTDQKISLKVKNINFTKDGPALGPIHLELQNDVPIRLSNAARIVIKKSANTYFKVDCNGFAGMSIDANAEICRKYLTPLNAVTLEPLPDPELVKAAFTISIANWESFYVSVSLPPFAVTKYENLKWQISEAVFDFSDTQSPVGAPTEGYSSPLASSQTGFKPAWQGFYMNSLKLWLPKEFSKNSQPISIQLNRVMFDENKFSGVVEIPTPILPLDEGSAGGWAFSIDNIKLVILKHQFSTAGFGGKINVPIVKGATNTSTGITGLDCFNYSAMIFPDRKYQFTIGIPVGQEYRADLWKAGKLVLGSGSVLTLESNNGQFKADATLHGYVFIDANVGGFSVGLKDTLHFQSVKVMSYAPYFDVGTWKIPEGGGNKANGFPISVHKVRLTSPEPGITKLKFDIRLSLSKDKPNAEDHLGISAEGFFDIEGKLEMVGGRQKWVFQALNLTGLKVDASFKGNTIKGELVFYEDTSPDNKWGKGFRGVLDARFKSIESQIKAVAQFGHLDGGGGFKYFYVDALATWANGIPAFPPLTLIGFGGGVYHHMSRVSSLAGLPASGNNDPSLPSGLGVSSSGIHYVPNKNIELGLKAIGVFALPKKEAFNMNVSIEFAFNSFATGGGLARIDIDGTASFMKDVNIGLGPDSTAASNPGSFKAAANISAVFTPSFKLHGSLKTFVNVGNGAIVGSGGNGLMADAEFHIEPGKWWINVGTPANRAGLKLSIAGTTVGSVSAYFDIGKNIPPMPSLPPEVASLTGLGNFMTSESTRATGNGFAFGAEIDLGSGGEKCFPECGGPLYFYAEIRALVGFDLMLQDYGDATCSNMNNSELGINGWYASGQAYALLSSGVGVGFRFLGTNYKISVADINAAAALQMKLPNPFWARGAVGGRFSVLGGLVNGDINFKFTIGEGCEINGGSDPTDNLEIIQSIDPFDQSDFVDVSTHPGVTFSMPIGEPIPFGEGSDTYKVQLEYAKLIYRGYSVPVTTVWHDKTFLELVPQYMMASQDTFTVEVKVKVFKNGAYDRSEIKSVRFKTGSSYLEIPDFNVKAAYPMDGQYNFYDSEWNQQKGYVMLYANQPDLFQQTIVARLTSQGGTKTQFPVTYIANGARLEFPLPASAVFAQTMYKLELLIPNRVATDGGGGQGESITQTSTNDAARMLTETDESADSSKVIYTSFFRNSQYSTFSSKIQALSNTNLQISETYVYAGFKVMVHTEPFDDYEIGESNASNIVKMEADLDNTPWFKNHVKGLIYDLYAGAQPNSENIWVNERPAEPHGRIPRKAMHMESTGNDLRIIEGDFTRGQAPSLSGSQFVCYNVANAIGKDWEDIVDDTYAYYNRDLDMGGYGCCMMDDCCTYWTYPPPPTMTCPSCDGKTSGAAFRNYWINNKIQNLGHRDMYRNLGFNHPYPGNYKVIATYHLPGTGVTTSTTPLFLKKN